LTGLVYRLCHLPPMRLAVCEDILLLPFVEATQSGGQRLAMLFCDMMRPRISKDVSRDG
jgi:hypothetical protein